ncbi:MAG: EAL domain-containing protein [Thermoanaerobaculia bacterium]|nr:EAL domain-containing protein [Thermoanaerobaculia bacterium]
MTMEPPADLTTPGAVEALLEALDEAVLLVDPGQRILQASPAVERLWGHAARSLAGKSLGVLLSSESRSATGSAEDGHRLEAFRQDGSSFPVWVRRRRLPDARAGTSLLVVRDLSPLEETRDHLRRLEKALATMQVGVAFSDRDQRLLYVNPALAEMHGYREEELLGEPLAKLAPDDPTARLEFREVKQLRRLHYETRHRRRDGGELAVEVMRDLVTDGRGDPAGLVTICQEITQRKLAEEALRASEERYALAVEGAKDGIWDWDIPRSRIFFSGRWKELLGFGEHEIGDDPEEWFSRVHPADRERLQNRLDEHLEGASPHFEDEHRLVHRDGSHRWVLARGLAVRDADGKPHRMAGSLSDITDRTARDPLTELPNRVLLRDRLDRALARLRRRDIDHLAVLAIGLDRLAVVDESLGPQTADELLVACARRLEQCLRPGDTLARVEGDTFLALLEDVRSPVNAAAVAERILADLRRPFAVAGHELLLTAHIGVAVSALGEEEAADLLRDVDAAMRRARTRERGTYQLFDREMRQAALRQLRLEADLVRALERRELVLRYQPIVRLRDGVVVFLEALLRWHHPERGLLAPGEFLDIAIESGAIDAISTWTLDEACSQLAAWDTAEPAVRHLPISVNLSAAQLSDPGLAGQIEAALAHHAVEPSRLRIEITETALARDPRVARAVLERLRSLGAGVAIDDFGVGYSSLGHLHQFPADVLKIDRSFVASLARTGQSAELVRSIVELGKRLGLNVVAEGVETAAQRRLLLSLGCENAQGFLYSPALPPEEARAFALAAAGRRRTGASSAA